MIKCQLELDLSLSKGCIISEISITLRIHANPDANPPAQEVAAIQTTRATLQIEWEWKMRMKTIMLMTR